MQWIYLRDTRHRRNKGTSYRSTRTNQISVFIRFPHQFLRNDVHYGITIADNGIQFSIQTFLYDFWQRITIHFVCFVITDITKHLIRIFDNRRTFIRSDRRYFFTHICNQICIFDDNFLCLFASKILKLFKHLFGCPKKQRCLFICILKSLSRHNNTAVNLIIWIQKMHITGCNDRFVKLFTQTNNFLVNFNQIIIRSNRRVFIPDKKRIVSKRLYFQIVIEIHKSRNLFLRPAI